jgi:23S rRNA (uracil1939-C5)-methyltransferase
VDSYPPAINDAHHNLAELDNVSLHEASASQFLSDTPTRYDLIVLDPPASGVDEQTLSLLAGRGTPRLVYISSNPASLARDLAGLARAGYSLQSVQGIDFAPQTAYVEAVCLLERR